jgi:glyoxylase-like metal-dependent hydrolase (beta-lactamase superfamily II)
MITDVCRPIATRSKARRLGWSVPPNLISWSWMKLLRENNKTMRIYDVNPYVEVYQFYDNLYGLYNQNLDGVPDNWMWLIDGPEKAMVIDTAYGLGDSKGLVDQITGGKPLIVANTHGHFDHCLGNCRFAKAYIHEYDHDTARANAKPTAWDFLFDKNGKNIYVDFDRKDLPVFKDYELVAVRNGATFNLGGDHEIELIWTGGHSPGHSMFLDKKSRYLFTGDIVASHVMMAGTGPRPGLAYGQYANLTTWRDNLSKLVARIDEYDYLFPGHMMANIENSVMATTLEAVEAILANPGNSTYIEEVTPANGIKQKRIHKYVRGFTTIGYSEEGVYPPKG